MPLTWSRATKTDLSNVRRTRAKTAAEFFQLDADRPTMQFEVRRQVSAFVRHLKRHHRLVEFGPATKLHPECAIECPGIRDPEFVERPFFFRNNLGFQFSCQVWATVSARP